METALRIASQSRDEVPIGVVIVLNNEIISSSANEVIKNNDPTAHAEIIAIRKASEKLGTRFLTNCEIYSTLEPCPMCAYAISLARIKAIYFGSYDKKRGAISNCMINSTFHHKPNIYDGIMESESNAILKKFFNGLR